MEERVESNEYCIVQDLDGTPAQLLSLMQGLEEALGDSVHNSNNIKRVILETVHWSDESWTYLQRILQAHSLECLEFRSTFDRIALENLGMTKRLELQYTPLEPFISTLVPSGSYLKELVLANSTLSLGTAASLADCLTQPTFCLTSLDLSGTRFLDDAAACLARGLRNHGGSLETICVSECNLMDEQIGALVGSLAECCAQDPPTFSLKELDISFNKSRHVSTAKLALLLYRSRLRKLSMGFQAFGEAKRIDMSAIFASIANNRYLQEFEIGGNSLRDNDMPALVSALVRNRSLKVLDISENRFTNVGIAQLADGLRQTVSLQQLLMEDIRDIDGQGIRSLVDALESSGNCNLHTIEVAEELQHSPDWEMLTYILDLNWSGGRLLMQTKEDDDEFPHHAHGRNGEIPLSLWSLVMERVNFPARRILTARTPCAPDILYYMIREKPMLFHQ